MPFFIEAFASDAIKSAGDLDLETIIGLRVELPQQGSERGDAGFFGDLHGEFASCDVNV